MLKMNQQIHKKFKLKVAHIAVVVVVGTVGLSVGGGVGLGVGGGVGCGVGPN